MKTLRFLIHSILAFTLLGVVATSAVAAVSGQIGAYKVEVTTDPPVIPVGRARLLIAVKDAAGKPVEGLQVRSLVKMPAMSMGEKETTARPQPGKPGVYQTDASFMMAGAYDAAITITGPKGTANGKVALETGQGTDAAQGSTLRAIMPWLLLGVLAVFIAVRMRQTGQRVAWRSAANRGTVSGIVLLIAIFGVSLYAIGHWRRPGAMTPIEAQAMEMNTPAPPGAAAVTLAEVTSGPVENMVRYTGQAVGFNEQDVIARTQGWLTWMPFYNGQKVKAGEVVARLDTSQVQPQIAEREAAVHMASQGVNVMVREHRQSLADVNKMRAEVRGKNDALAGAQAEIAAAQEERASAEAELAAKQSMVTDAEAMVSAMKADQQFRQQQSARNKTLVDKGALSKEEFQRDASMAANADAKVQQAQAKLSQAHAEVRSAQAMVRRADAMIRATDKKRQQMASDVLAAEAAVRSAEAMAEASKAKIGEAQAGVAQARGSLATVTTARNYSEVRSLIDGVVTQRVISPGQLVNPGQAILKVAQIDPIRLQANVAEVDMGKIHVGSRVIVRSQDASKKPVIAQVTSVTPAVDPTARTGIVEAVVPNTDGRFVPGQFVTMDIATARSQNALRVPAAAIHTHTPAGRGILASGATSYVWVAEGSGGDGQYAVKPVDVQTGVSDGQYTEIVSGLKRGDKVVLSGAADLKTGDTVSTPDSERSMLNAQRSSATVEVSSKGFSPVTVAFKAGVPAKLTFIRKDTQNCATEVVLPEYGIKRALPLNQPVVIEFTPKAGEVNFTCGMNMLSGKVVAR